MADLAAGGAVGQAFSLLYTGVSTLVINSLQFKPLLEELIVKLNLLKPVIKELGDCNGELDHPIGKDYYEKQMEKGTRLIDKLSKVGRWNLLKVYYTTQLVEYDRSLGNMLLFLMAEGVKDGKYSSSILRSMESRFSRNDDQEQNQNVLSGGSQTGTILPKPPSFPVGLDVPLEELKMKLLKDGRVSMLSVTAPGGSGKSTLAQMFCHDQDVKAIFGKRIFFATVSNKPDLDWLKTSVQQFLNEAEENAALLVLDDVWPDTSETLLEEFYQLSEGSSYKILVTSRFFPKYGSHYRLKALNDDEAMTLLQNSTSLKQTSPTLLELQKQIIKYCKMSPLASTVVGKSLFRESAEIWLEKVTEWSRNPIFDNDKALHASLQSSLDVLGKDGAIIKECFIDLASLPEDRTTPAGVLIDMWAELYELEKDDALSIAKLQHLNNRNLATLVVSSEESNNVDSCYSEQFVSQHGMLRELALHQIRQDPVGESKRLNIDIPGDDLPKRWTEGKNKLKETRLLSISTDGMFSSKWQNMHLPKAKVLLLNFQTKNYTLPNCSEKMTKALKVLIVRNNGSTPAELSNFKLLFSSPKLKRVRLERISSLTVAKEKKLKYLVKLSLFMCNIGQASGMSPIRFFKAFPNLVEINIDYCNDLENLPADICVLKCLKKLVITNCHKLSTLPEDIGNLINLEVLRLRSCTSLEFLESSMKNLKNLTFLDISNCFSIKELPKDIGQMRKLAKIDMRQCIRLQELPASILDLESTMKDVICDEETEELWEPFPNLNFCFTVVKKEYNLVWLLS